MTVEEVIDHDTGAWNFESIEGLLSDSKKQAIRLVPISLRFAGDRLIWPLEKFGSYSVKSGYHWINRLAGPRTINQASTSSPMTDLQWGHWGRATPRKPWK
ncbi:hypothetical protein CerSpe_028510 [Prunus speciosa]